MLGILGDIASVAGFLLGILYGTGLVIVTIHLSRYGVTNIYLVRTKYLVVGFAYFLHVLGMSVLSAPVVLALILILGLDTLTYIFAPVSVFGLFLVLYFGYTPNFFERTIRSFLVRRFPQSTRIDWYIWYGATYCSFLLPWHSLIRSFMIDNAILRPIAILLLSAVFLSGIVYYALFLYQAPISVGNPALELIGSGRPIRVRLIIDKEAITAGLQEYGLFTLENEISESVSVLDETENYFLLLVDLDGKERALKLSKDIVHSVIYLP